MSTRTTTVPAQVRAPGAPARALPGRRAVLHRLVLVLALVVAGAVVGPAPARAATGSLVLDPAVSAALGTGFDGDVWVVEPTADGGYLVGGAFSQYQGAPVATLVRLDADLTLDAGFAAALGAGFAGSVWAVVPTADGGYVVGGDFAQYQGTPVPALVRLGPDLTLDTGFVSAVGAGFDGVVRTVATTPDGGWLVGGDFSQYQGQPAPNLAHLSADLSLDTAFAALLGTGFNFGVYDAVPTGDGYVVAGDFSQYQGTPAWHLLRLTADLTPDAAFTAALGTGFDDAATAVVPQDDGGYLVGGAFTAYQGQTTPALARLRPDLTLDAAFAADLGAGFSSAVVDLVPGTDGAFLAAGVFTTFQGTPAPHLARVVRQSVVVQPPGDRTGTVGSPTSLTLSASVTPEVPVVLAATGLPDGLVLDPATGTVAGMPTTAGRFDVAVTATAHGLTDTATFTWTIEAATAPTLRLDWPRLSAGELQVARATGFAPGEEVTFTLAPGRVAVGRAVAGTDGAADLSFTVPAGTAPGTVTVTATGGSGAASATFVVVAVPAETPTPPQEAPQPGGTPAGGGPAAGSLAQSGTESRTAGLVAVALLLAGAGAVAVARRASRGRD